PFRSPFRPYNRTYAYRGLTAFAPLSMAVSECEKALFDWRWPRGFVCPECGYTHHCLLNTNQLYQCYYWHH
ncbi:MAG: transposase, partial [Candidatus Thiodiazotropha sp. (ex Lucinoma aequizonata)]|nr:transposase [Candidatus Thiodiazotropha sp. (ex Lucinoma aequizonata)]